ncbi:hypothetical protein GCM10010277_72230 [Streptomyces longisporoflavus]|nr:hypothetical protein GCM10010277_72230 [Streptomyces longisporoflavus]
MLFAAGGRNANSVIREGKEMRLELFPVISLGWMPAHVAEDDDENWKASAGCVRRADE